MTTKYVVERRYSKPTAQKELWQAMSRPMRSQIDAQLFMEYLQENEDTTGRKFRLILIVKETI